MVIKRLTKPEAIEQALSVCSEHYRNLIIRRISNAAKHPALRLSSVLHFLIPHVEVDTLIKELTADSTHLTNTVRRTIKYDLIVNHRTLFKIKDFFNLYDNTSISRLLAIMEKLNHIDYKQNKADMIPVHHLVPDPTFLTDTTPTKTAQKHYENESAEGKTNE
jgi:hypothetical protein